MKKIAIFCLLSILLFALPGYSQNPDLTAEDAIRYINEKIKGIAEIKNEKGIMVIQFYEKGKINRTDKVSFAKLNPESVEYFPEEKAIVLKCIQKDCIERRIINPKTAGQFSRISIFGTFDAKTQMGLIHAFEHLLMLFYDLSYKSNKPFER